MSVKLNAIQFYTITKETLEKLALERGIDDLSCYYKLTDKLPEMPIAKYTGMSQIFAQLAFHAQNATMISSIVNFERNQNFLNKTLCNFNPEEFLKKYNKADREKNVKNIVEDLRFKNNEGLKWDSSKSKPENKDSIVKRYANTLLDGALYLSQFKNRGDFLNDLLKHYKNKDFRKLISYFRGKVKHGFSIALTCDFLKEFDLNFCDLAKPDIHIKDTLCVLNGYEDNYYSGAKKEFECIENMQSLVMEINENLPTAEQITVYQLDRMIWLICSGRFFLHNTEDSKTQYLRFLKEKQNIII